MSKKEKNIKPSISTKNINTPNKKNKLSKNNINNKYLFTNQQYNTPQELFDFISDKGKISLKSYFDQKGSNEFLSGKSEAMKKIELNENIIEENNNFCNSTKKIEIDKNKLYIKNNNNFTRKTHSSKNSVDHSNIKSKKTETNITKAKSSQNLNDSIELKNKSSKFNKDYAEQNNTKNELDSIDNNICSNSQLFNNCKEYQKSLKIISREDLVIFEEILSNLK